MNTSSTKATTKRPTPNKNAGAKLLIAAFSVAATLSGWAWLAQNEQPVTATQANDAQGQTARMTANPVFGQPPAPRLREVTLPTHSSGPLATTRSSR